MIRPAVLLAALLAGSLPPVAHAQVDVEVVDRAAGRTLPVHWSDGRRYVAGEPGREYGLRLRNRSGERVLAVVSVDGVNVVSGETASPSQSGYVLEPWQETTIDGWRKSLDRVAAFYFTSLPDAYATRTGRPANVGVIGVAVFHERPRAQLGAAEPYAGANRYEAPAPEARTAESASAAAPPPGAPVADASSARAAGAATAQEAERRERAVGDKAFARRLGTGHGRRLDSHATWTAFERASEVPASVLAIHYDSRRNLVALGVLPPERHARRLPEPFPGPFAPDPR
jgi:hypothetical protein